MTGSAAATANTALCLAPVPAAEGSAAPAACAGVFADAPPYPANVGEAAASAAAGPLVGAELGTGEPMQGVASKQKLMASPGPLLSKSPQAAAAPATAAAGGAPPAGEAAGVLPHPAPTQLPLRSNRLKKRELELSAAPAPTAPTTAIPTSTAPVLAAPLPAPRTLLRRLVGSAASATGGMVARLSEVAAAAGARAGAGAAAAARHWSSSATAARGSRRAVTAPAGSGGGAAWRVRTMRRGLLRWGGPAVQ